MKSIFFVLSFLWSSAWALDTRDLCGPGWKTMLFVFPESRESFTEACKHVGKFERSLLPDTISNNQATHRGEVFLYDEFFESLERSSKFINGPQICTKEESQASLVVLPTTIIEDAASGKLQISVVDEAELKEIFEEIRKDPKYAFEYQDDGCWARAHLIARALEKRGIRAGKVFAEGVLSVQTGSSESERLFLSYHVAPFVAIQTEKGVELRVLDASFFEKPVSLKEWTDRMMPSKEIKEDVVIYMTDRFVFKALHGAPTWTLNRRDDVGMWDEALTAYSEAELRRFGREFQSREAQLRESQ